MNKYFDMIRAFKSDCDLLIEMLKKNETQNFNGDFVPLWRSLKFNLIYENCPPQGVGIDFKEDTLQIAKDIMLKVHFEYGLYLLFALFSIQEEPKSCIRLEEGELQKIQSCLISEKEDHESRLKFACILAKLIKEGAFSSVRFCREFSIEGQQRARLIYGKQNIPMVMNEEREVMDKNWFDNFLIKHDLLDTISAAEKKSIEARNKIKEEYPELDLQLDVDRNENIIDVLTNKLSDMDMPSVSQNKSNTINPGIIPDVTSDIGERRRKLKNRNIAAKPSYSKFIEDSDELEFSDSMPVGPRPKKSKKKKGCPRGERKRFMSKLVNDPELEN